MKVFFVIFVSSALLCALVEGTSQIEECLNRVNDELQRTDISPLKLQCLEIMKSRIEKLNAISDISDEIISKTVSTLEPNKDVDSAAIDNLLSADIIADNFRKTGHWYDEDLKTLIEKTGISENGQKYLQCRKSAKEASFSSFKNVLDWAMTKPENVGDVQEEDLTIDFVRKIISAYAHDFENGIAERIGCLLLTFSVTKIGFVEPTQDKPSGIWEKIDVTKMSSTYFAANLRNALEKGALNIVDLDSKPTEMSKAIIDQRRLIAILTSVYSDGIDTLLGRYLTGTSVKATPETEKLSEEFKTCLKNNLRKKISFDDFYSYRDDGRRPLPSTHLLVLAGFADQRGSNAVIVDCFGGIQTRIQKEYTDKLTRDELRQSLSRLDLDEKYDVGQAVKERVVDFERALNEYFIRRNREEAN